MKKKKTSIKFIIHNYLLLSIFLKEEMDVELMTSLSSELKNLGPWKKKNRKLLNFLFDNRVDGRHGNF